MNARRLGGGRRRRFALSRTLAAAVCVALAWSGTAVGHPDPPGPPSILTAVTLDKVVVKSQNRGRSASTVFVGNVAFSGALPADGIDSNAEFQVVALVVHTNHGMQDSVVTNDAMASAVWEPKEQIYEHDECFRRENIEVRGALTEIDADGWSALGINLTSAAGGAAGGFVFGNLPGAVIGFLISQIAGMNGNDDWGSFTGAIPENDKVVFDLTSAEGRAEVTFSGFTDEYVSDRGCASEDEPPPTGVTPATKTAAVFDPLHEALLAASEIGAEQGNPAGLTTSQVRGIRRTGRALVMGLAQTSAGLVVDRARALEGNGADAFLAGQEHLAAGQNAAALEQFQAALHQAFEAEEAAEPAQEPVPLPFDVVLSPAAFSAEAGSSFTLLASVLGAQGTPELSVSSPVDGITARVVDVKEPMQLSGIDIAIDRRVRPGVYTLDVAAYDGSSEAASTVRLRVEPRSLRTCGGQGVTIAGTPGSDTIRGSARADVIAARGGGDVVRGRGGGDVVCGGTGPDRLYGGAGNDRLVGDAGGDELYGGTDRDRLFGSTGRDTLYGGLGNDYLEGGRGVRDACLGGDGRDRILVGGRHGCERYR